MNHLDAKKTAEKILTLLDGHSYKDVAAILDGIKTRLENLTLALNLPANSTFEKVAQASPGQNAPASGIDCESFEGCLGIIARYCSSPPCPKERNPQRT